MQVEENENGPENCPDCGSHDIHGGHLEIELAILTQDVWCRGCDTRWVDVFEYTGIRRN